MNEIVQFDRLYKWVEKGDPVVWDLRVTPHPDGTATIETTYGRHGGKMMSTSRHVTSGKNVGRSNATTAYEQAVKEASALHTSQQERGQYGTTPEESRVKLELSPMLAEVYKDHSHRVDWSTAYAQPKLDGLRCVARWENGTVALRTRNGDCFTALGHIAEALSTVLPNGSTFDGELYTHGQTLQTINSWARRRQEETVRLRYHVYDIFNDGPYHTRYESLAQLFASENAADKEFPVRKLVTRKVQDETELYKFQAECIEKGFEGAMLRHGAAPYEAGKRSKSLLKVKTFQDSEFTVVGVKEGDGKFKGMAIFRCATDDYVTFDVTAPGTHEEKKEYLRQAQAFIGKRLTVKYANLTPDGKPFHPVAKCFRE